MKKGKTKKILKKEKKKNLTRKTDCYKNKECLCEIAIFVQKEHLNHCRIKIFFWILNKYLEKKRKGIKKFQNETCPVQCIAHLYI